MQQLFILLFFKGRMAVVQLSYTAIIRQSYYCRTTIQWSYSLLSYIYHIQLLYDSSTTVVLPYGKLYDTYPAVAYTTDTTFFQAVLGYKYDSRICNYVLLFKKGQILHIKIPFQASEGHVNRHR